MRSENQIAQFLAVQWPFVVSVFLWQKKIHLRPSEYGKILVLLLNFLNVISLVSVISYRKQSYEILELS